jgi:replicative DNA helicase
MEFDENTLLYALSSRPEDARKFAGTFKPDWLNTVEYRPILAEIYAFTRKYGEPPSISTLHKSFSSKDEELYKLRYKNALDKISHVIPDNSNILFTLDQARGVAIVRSFLEMSNDPAFLQNQVDFDGNTVLNKLHTWFSSFAETTNDRTMDIKTAVDHLINNHGFDGPRARIPCGIKVIDEWTGGGLRPKQVGLVVAPTGHGKSAVLSIMAHKIAAVELKRSWIITNELSIEEITERMLTRLSGVSLDKIMDNPAAGYRGLGRYWQGGLDKRMRITEVTREISIDDIEAEMAKWSNIQGWKPDVLIIDFMERMKPSLGGYKRDKEWQWIGAIAQDLVRLAKRHNVMIWSAVQTNREGLTADKINMSMVQSSIRQLQECTSVIGMQQITPPGQTDAAIQFTSLKQRQSKRSGNAVVVKCDLAKMNITNEEIDMDDLIEIEEYQDTRTPREKQKARQKHRESRR